MLLFPYEIRDSLIPGAGKGLFATAPVEAGRVMYAPANITGTVQLSELLAVPDHPHGYCSVRWFEEHCTLAPDWPDDCYVNHSFTPNGLWHFGFILALRAIAPGEEVTVDYRHLLGPGVEMEFRDAVTGRPIVGFSWKESILASARALIGVMEPRD